MPTPAVRNNNPGNLKDPATGKFRIFKTPEEGLQALKGDLNVKITGKSRTGLLPSSSLSQFASVYAPSSDNNDPHQYARKLATNLGVTPETPISELSGRIDDFAKAIAQNEDTTMAQKIGAGPKAGLTHDQMIANIEAMEKQGATQQEIQEYLNGLAKPQNAPQTTQTQQPSAIAQIGGDVAQGAAKGALGLIYGASAMNAGPIGEGMMSHTSPEFQKMMADYKASLAPTNAAQFAGDIGASLLFPGGGGLSLAKEASTGARILGAGKEATEIVAPKLTQKAVEGELKSMRPTGDTQGLAGLVKPYVEQGTMRAKNTASQILKNTNQVKTAITDEASLLVQKLKGMDVTPILSQDELAGVFNRTLKAIEENPYLDESAAKSAKKMFDLFYSKLPQGRDIDAADLLQARKAFDKAVSSMKPTAFDPKNENATSLALRAIRQELNDLIANKAPDVAVKASLKKQSMLYDILENVAEKGAPIVKKAREIENLPFIARTMAKHPFLTQAAGTAVGAGIAGLIGLPAYNLLSGAARSVLSD